MRLELAQPNRPAWRLLPGWLRLAIHVLGESALWLALGAGLLALILAYQVPRSIFVNIGGPFDNTLVQGFHEPETSSTGDAQFRWSTGAGAFYFPGLGTTPSDIDVTLQLSSGRGAGSAPLPVSLTVNGHPAGQLALAPESAPYVVRVQREWIDASGDLRIAFTTSTFRSGSDKRDLGFLADFARVDLPFGPVLPSIPQLVWLLVSGLLIYLMARGVWLRERLAGFVAFGFLLACAGGIALARMFVTIYTGRLVVVLVVALVVAALAEFVLRLLTRTAGWRGGRSVPEWGWAGLRALLLVTLVLKVGGVLYPHTFIIDAEFHIKYTTFMSEGRPFEQFFGKSLALSVMPPDEWGSAKAFIPYSPFFYVVSAPLTALPFPLEQSIPSAMSILESLRVGLVFLLGLALGTARRSGDPPGSTRIALASATVYAFTPATFLLQQFGNWPTQISLWLLSLWAALTCLYWRRFTKPLNWVISTLALALTMLSYTVTAVYVGIFAGMVVLFGWIFSRDDRKRWVALALSLVVATLLAVLIYYGRYIGVLIESTLPTFASAAEEQGKLTTLRGSWGEFFTTHLARAMQSYRLDVVYALGVAGTVWLFLGRRRAARPRLGLGGGRVKMQAAPIRTASWQGVWIGAWLALFPLFTLADFYVDQALKQFWIALPSIALVGAMWLMALRARAEGAVVSRLLLWLLGAALVWQSLSLWVFRLFLHNR